MVVGRVEGHDLTNGHAVEFLRQIFVRAVEQGVRFDLTLRRRALRELDVVAHRQDAFRGGPGGQHAGAGVPQGFDGDVELGLGNAGDGIIDERGVGVGATEDAVARRMGVDQETGAGVWVADLGGNGEVFPGVH